MMTMPTFNKNKVQTYPKIGKRGRQKEWKNQKLCQHNQKLTTQ